MYFPSNLMLIMFVWIIITVNIIIELNVMILIYYVAIYTPKQLQEINKYFNQCESVLECYETLIGLFTINKAKIKEAILIKKSMKTFPNPVPRPISIYSI